MFAIFVFSSAGDDRFRVCWQGILLQGAEHGTILQVQGSCERKTRDRVKRIPTSHAKADEKVALGPLAQKMTQEPHNEDEASQGLKGLRRPKVDQQVDQLVDCSNQFVL